MATIEKRIKSHSLCCEMLADLANKVAGFWREYATQYDYTDQHQPMCDQIIGSSELACTCGLDDFFRRLEALLDGDEP